MAPYIHMLLVLLVAKSQLTRGNIFNDIFRDRKIPGNRLSRQDKCGFTEPDGTQSVGVCATKAECLLAGGAPRGRCGLLSTCCSHSKGCGRATDAKVSYFAGETGVAAGVATPVLCTLEVRRANANVCQLRVDFQEFQTSAPVASGTLRRCEDKLTVSPQRGLPEICGFNTGQHIYLQFPNSTANMLFSMQVTSTDVRSYWNLKITQLECPRRESIFAKVDRVLVSDYNQLAPIGCLQYFTARKGTIRSLGYDPSVNPTFYASNQMYSICLKRYDDVCGFTLGGTLSIFCANDRFEVPGLPENTDLCGTPPAQLPVIATPPGPLLINFYANDITDTTANGFDLTYDLNACTI